MICASIFKPKIDARAALGRAPTDGKQAYETQLSRRVTQMTNKGIFIHGALSKIFEETLKVIRDNKVFKV